MLKILEKDIKKRSIFLKSDLNKYLIDENQISEDPKRIWFKGCRYR
mgnify:CR=1 FL=1